ncbi:MAG: capsular polysaccharide biosynthesis protein [Neisseria sp.]|uniref:capsular polysaccharide biosynthesis protein n=1 Tax=Neisseria sp. TaxID=192066 RepID=UPI0026DC507C|nr:capsular polysaccharide biosynthesis protein [Neisseria sp.]MDO4641344.1 capsular polysaccharide biosynthesis protein [Neisseria sp.]
MKKAAIFSRGILKIPDLKNFFPGTQLSKPNSSADCVFGWGLRPTADKARAYAKKRNIPYIALEDGFLRSVGLGVDGYPPFAIVWDDKGIYYDTTRPSRLEQLVLSSNQLEAAFLKQSEEAIASITANELSKYNHAPSFSDRHSQPALLEKEIILVIDQTFGDMAVQYGGADEQIFQQMFKAALHEHPKAEIWVKTHPDVLTGKKKGYLTDLARQTRVNLIAEDINPISLIQRSDKVYCVTSHMGFEALLCGKPVSVFGKPWYAGWGLTDDRHADMATLHQAGRRAPRSLAQLFSSAYLQYTSYINPNTGESGNIFDVIAYLKQARLLNQRLHGHLYCVGMSLWKRSVIKPFFNLPSCTLHFVSSTNKIPQNLPDKSRLLIWGNGKDDLLSLAHARKIPLLRMEDGFIRSVGLGSNLVPPLSLVADDLGIYFNAQTPSRLEHILQNHAFSEQDKITALALQQKLITSNISKYNVGIRAFERPDTPKKIILVPGQVEDDASIRYGSPEIHRNAALLSKVRELNPNSFIIYKPHPDVVSGNRIGHVNQEDTDRLADMVAIEADILSCLKIADEVHTMTSLTGFEALLRGKTVHCYGLPFYAGWGLTHDYIPLPRRTKKLNLAELISGTLVYYPLYADYRRHTIIDADTAIRILSAQKATQAGQTGLRRSWFAKQRGKLAQLYLSLKK